MTVMWSVIGFFVFLLWVVTIVDIFRRHYSAGRIVAYIALVILLPFVGALIYWAIRKPSQSDLDSAYLGEAELRRSTASRPFDSTGL